MVDILFIIPPFKYRRLDAAAPLCPRLGIISLAGILEKEGFKVKIIDAAALRLTLDEIRQQVIKDKPSVVGVTAVTAEFPQALQITRIVKGIDKRIITIMGGPHVSVMPESVRQETIDYGVIGEAEVTIVELINFLLSGKGLKESILGLVFKLDSTILHFTGERPLIDNLDILPMPAYHLLPMDRYRNYAMFDDGRKFCTVITSRGCPFACTFCTSSRIFGRRWRGMTPPRMLKEIEFLYLKYGIRHLYFQDDEFTLNYKRTEEFCNLLREKRMDLHWGCLARADNLDEHLVEIMANSGCKEVALGLEFGYQEGLERINKRITLAQSRKSVALLNKYKIFIGASFLMGFPWENKEQICKTVAFARSIKADMYYFQVLVPYPGTAIYEQMKEEGLIISNDWSRYVQHAIAGTDPVIRTRYLNNKELKMLNKSAFRKVFFRPLFLLRKITGIKNLRYFKRGIISGWLLLKNIFSPL